MKVLKFGGTSVGSAVSIRNVKEIISNLPGDKLLVLSAMSGVTNQLVEISEFVKTGSLDQVSEKIQALKAKHFSLIDELVPDKTSNQSIKDHIVLQLEELVEICQVQPWSNEVDAKIITTGERLLTSIFSSYLKFEEVANTLLDARKFMKIHNLENPDTGLVGELLNDTLKSSFESNILITQGFVRLNAQNEVSTLKRGGSDYTATILGAAIRAAEIQIWTDISGLHNNDPRFVENTHAVSQLSFEEAAELAYFGAKILHPQTISPVIGKNIPVYLKNTFTPEATGTCISALAERKGLKAISAKDEITAIKIKSNRMLMAHGFLKKIFEVFDTYETSIDMITTSEIAISLTIDNTANLDLILQELDQYGEISVDASHSIICVVGEGLIEDRGTSRLFEILQDVPIRMISYGGSSNNISLLVDTRNKIEVLQKLNEKLFVNQLKSV
ncbi:aspartate kinase [Christiangramia forsetii]|uniref:Aspartokinase n=2 Tax=Christiangramia forsetii TaxID=411153 RepID=A0M1M8_CHRFK|nr:aspartate kinase [Christiangramia forsetii]GGG42140.1 aspartokinase [Christiangramia forsetii]CAL66523.1 aspartokinase [Christiangramia forsetii KT0803]